MKVCRFQVPRPGNYFQYLAEKKVRHSHSRGHTHTVHPQSTVTIFDLMWQLCRCKLLPLSTGNALLSICRHLPNFTGWHYTRRRDKTSLALSLGFHCRPVLGGSSIL